MSIIPPEWRTHAESTDYRETPNYDDTVAFARRLAHASSIIEYEGFGFSGQGRELPLIIASETRHVHTRSRASPGQSRRPDSSLHSLR